MKLWVCFPIPAILCLFLSREEIARPCDQIIKAGYHIVEGEKKVWNINSWRHTYWQSCKRRSSAASAHASLRRPHWTVHNPRTCNFPQRANNKKKRKRNRCATVATDEKVMQAALKRQAGGTRGPSFTVFISGEKPNLRAWYSNVSDPRTLNPRGGWWLLARSW